MMRLLTGANANCAAPLTMLSFQIFGNVPNIGTTTFVWRVGIWICGGGIGPSRTSIYFKLLLIYDTIQHYLIQAVMLKSVQARCVNGQRFGREFRTSDHTGDIIETLSFKKEQKGFEVGNGQARLRGWSSDVNPKKLPNPSVAENTEDIYGIQFSRSDGIHRSHDEFAENFNSQNRVTTHKFQKQNEIRRWNEYPSETVQTREGLKVIVQSWPKVPSQIEAQKICGRSVINQTRQANPKASKMMTNPRRLVASMSENFDSIRKSSLTSPSPGSSSNHQTGHRNQPGNTTCDQAWSRTWPHSDTAATVAPIDSRRAHGSTWPSIYHAPDPSDAHTRRLLDLAALVAQRSQNLPGPAARAGLKRSPVSMSQPRAELPPANVNNSDLDRPGPGRGVGQGRTPGHPPSASTSLTRQLEEIAQIEALAGGAERGSQRPADDSDFSADARADTAMVAPGIPGSSGGGCGAEAPAALNPEGGPEPAGSGRGRMLRVSFSGSTLGCGPAAAGPAAAWSGSFAWASSWVERLPKGGRGKARRSGGGGGEGGCLAAVMCAVRRGVLGRAGPVAEPVGEKARLSLSSRSRAGRTAVCAAAAARCI